MYDFPQKKFSMGYSTYSPIPDPSKNWSVKRAVPFLGNTYIHIWPQMFLPSDPSSQSSSPHQNQVTFSSETLVVHDAVGPICHIS